MEAIILAGGLGTRLQGVIGAYPKCMAPVNGKPFLHYIMQYLGRQGCNRVVLSLGYKHGVIEEWLGQEVFDFPYEVVIEAEPLGTGGGIQLALKATKEDDVVVLNGDTFFDVVLSELLAVHKRSGAETTLALKEMQQFDRYGIVNTNQEGIITSFEEKRYQETGLINGGAYVINKPSFLDKKLPLKFSFEKDYLEAYISGGKLHGYESNGYFI